MTGRRVAGEAEVAEDLGRRYAVGTSWDETGKALAVVALVVVVAVAVAVAFGGDDADEDC